jgi:hypothetical protein
LRAPMTTHLQTILRVGNTTPTTEVFVEHLLSVTSNRINLSSQCRLDSHRRHSLCARGSSVFMPSLVILYPRLYIQAGVRPLLRCDECFTKFAFVFRYNIVIKAYIIQFAAAMRCRTKVSNST